MKLFLYCEYSMVTDWTQ